MSIYLRRMSSFYGQAELPCPFLLWEIIQCINKAQSPLDHKSSPSAQWGQNRGRMRMVQREDACHLTKNLACFPGGSDIKSLPSMRENRVRSLSRKIPWTKGMATHSSILAWRIPWTEDPGRLQSMVSQSRT